MGGQAEILPGIPGMMGFPAIGVGFLVRGHVGRPGQGRSQAPTPISQCRWRECRRQRWPA